MSTMADTETSINAVVAPKEKLQSHYEEHSSESYESSFFCKTGSDYTTYLQQLVQERLGWKQELSDVADGETNLRLLDIGGGTENFTQLILQGLNRTLGVEAVVVDPFLEPTTSNDLTNLHFVKAPAEDFLNLPSSAEVKKSDEWWRNEPYHQILLKEMVHHIDQKDRVGIFRGINHGLSYISGYDAMPAILIITRPEIDIDYPLWDVARKVWADHQPGADELVQSLLQAGFVRATVTTEAYPCRLPLERWQGMIKARCWSTFYHFTDAELDEACEAIAEEYACRLKEDEEGVKTIAFEDRLVFITAYKA